MISLAFKHSKSQRLIWKDRIILFLHTRSYRYVIGVLLMLYIFSHNPLRHARFLFPCTHTNLLMIHVLVICTLMIYEYESIFDNMIPFYRIINGTYNFEVKKDYYDIELPKIGWRHVKYGENRLIKFYWTISPWL